MVKATIRMALLASVLAAAGVRAEQQEPEIRRVVVSGFPVASPELRALAVVRGLDLDLDQYLTEAEIVIPLNRTQRSIDNARLRYYMDGRVDDNALRQVTRRGERGSLRHRTLARLAAANQEMVATSAFELSLVDESFHALFADLPGEQRAALLEADVAGNNDGFVTAIEFYSHNRRPLFRKPRFEADFGEAAYIEVLRLLGAL